MSGFGWNDFEPCQVVFDSLDRIENILLQNHENRLARVEDAVRVIKTKVGIK